MVNRIQDKQVRAMKPGDTPLTEPGGLIAKINNGKGKLRPVFYVRYSYNGKRSLLKLGALGDIGLKEARQSAERVKIQVADGIDPKESKQALNTRRSPTNLSGSGRKSNPGQSGRRVLVSRGTSATDVAKRNDKLGLRLHWRQESRRCHKI